jgi:hypothetical protein
MLQFNIPNFRVDGSTPVMSGKEIVPQEIKGLALDDGTNWISAILRTTDSG